VAITQNRLNSEAKRLSELLEEHDLKIVFAESCTGGLVSATLTRIPGVSAYHCGSAVVYRKETKSGWLGIPRTMLDKPGPVSRVVAAEMARRVLAKTPEADLSAAVTGHLGPGAPKRQDGLVYVALALRGPSRREKQPRVLVKKLHLQGNTDGTPPRTGRSLRIQRQRAAVHAVLSMVRSQLEEYPL